MNSVVGSKGGRSVEWLTPKPIIDAVGPFDLDPCAADPRPFDTAGQSIPRRENGMKRRWYGMVWLNPPYGHGMRWWVHRLANHGTGIALLFARPETKVWHEEIWLRATALLFIRRRVKFLRPDGTVPNNNGGGGSVLVAYGNEARARLMGATVAERGGIKGWFVGLRHRTVGSGCSE